MYVRPVIISFVCGLAMFSGVANCCVLFPVFCRCFEGFNATVLAYGQVGPTYIPIHPLPL